jgi:uroporphyrin-III C-methyltransferase / precorrin-2 dehydrogenase / sirohydrochlorin ferrochelatase
MSLHSLPVFLRLRGQPVVLVGEGEAAEAKKRLLLRAGAVIVGEDEDARVAIVADGDAAAAERMRARGMLVNVTDRPELCDFTLPAIVDRDPLLVAVGTGGASAGLAAALRQRLEALLPADLGALASALHAARTRLRAGFPDAGERRRALATALAGPLDPLGASMTVDAWLAAPDLPMARIEHIELGSDDPDELTLRQARLLGQAERVFHRPDVPAAILERARADAPRIACPAPPEQPGDGLSIDLAMAR